MGRKTVKFTREGIGKLPKDKPVVYKILTAGGKNNYTGVAKRWRVQERLQEHLAASEISGVKVQIHQVASIREAEQTEAKIIARSKPKYNEQGK